MSIETARTCPECGAELPAGTAPAACPNCLLGLGLTIAPGEDRGQRSGDGSQPAQDGGPKPSERPKAIANPASGQAQITNQFGDYELLEEIGHGGMGMVYKARQRSLDRIVALKVLLFGPHAPPEAVKRFRAEAVATAALQNSHIVAIHEVGSHASQHFLVMDFVEGQSLADVIGQQPLPAQRAARYVKTIAEAIHYAHERGILHRDLKPSNVLIDAHDQPRVTDFGLAKHLEGDSELTVSGQLLGSPNYMPPEQATGKRGRVSRRSDVYALGAILYHALTGRPPFVGQGVAETVQQVLNGEPVWPRVLNPGVPADLETVCLKCLEREPAKRYVTAQSLAEELGRFLNGQPVLARRIGLAGKAWRWCRRNPLLASATGVTLLSLLAGVIGVGWQWRRAEAQRTRAEEQTRRAQAEGLLARRNSYAADMELVQRALEDGDLGGAIALLNKYRPVGKSEVRNPKSENELGTRRASSKPSTLNAQPSSDLRGWEWRYLWARCRSDERFTLHQYSNAVAALAFSADGKWLAVRQEGGAVALWDAGAKQPVANLPGSGLRRALAFSPGTNLMAWGKLDASGSPVVSLWDLGARKEIAQFPHLHAVLSTAFSPDATQIAALAFDGTVRVWNLESTQVAGELPPDRDERLPSRYSVVTNVLTKEPVWSPAKDAYGCVLFSPDGRWLVIGESKPRIRLVDRATRKETVIPLPPPADGITALAFSPDSRLLAAGCGYEDKNVHVWDLAADTHLTLAGHRGYITGLAFSPAGRTLASVSADQSVRLWDLADRVERRRFQGHTDEVRTLAWSPEGHDVVTGGADGAVKYWDPAVQRPSPFVVLPRTWPWGLAFLPDSKSFLVTTRPRPGNFEAGPILRLEARWDSGAVAEVETLGFLGTNHTSLALSSDGRWLALGDWTGHVQIWDFPARRQVTNSVVGSKIFALIFSPGGHFLNCGAFPPPSQGRLVARFWEVPTWREIRLQNLDSNKGSDVNFSPDERTVGIGFEDGTAGWWDLVTGQRKATFPALDSWYVRVRFSPDGRWFATSSNNGLLTVWDVATRQLKPIPRRQGHVLQDLAFSPDEERLMATGPSPKGVARLWDVEIGREVVTLPGEPGLFPHLGFSPDGNTLFAASHSGLALLWCAPSWEEIEAFERRPKGP